MIPIASDFPRGRWHQSATPAASDPGNPDDMASSFDLIIFDCDGVLIDSEVISTHTLLDTLGVHGLEVDIGYVRRTYLGRTISVVKSDYLRLMGRDLAETFEADFLLRLSRRTSAISQ